MVFGDFGMSMLLQEGYKRSTLTRFAGTPNYCSPSMAKLLNGGKGYVNLYLNDMFSLR
jgi:serine/threonine protein kinase